MTVHHIWLYKTTSSVSVLPTCSAFVAVHPTWLYTLDHRVHLVCFSPYMIRCLFLCAGPVSVLLPCSIGVPGIIRPLCKLSHTHHLTRGWEDWGLPPGIPWISKGWKQQSPHPSSALSGFGWLGREARVTGITGLDRCPASALRGCWRYSAMTVYRRLLCFASELIHSVGLSVYIERHYCRLHTVTAAVNRDGCGSTRSLQKCVCFLREVSVFMFLSPATLRVETVQHWDH